MTEKENVSLEYKQGKKNIEIKEQEKNPWNW